MVILLPKMAFGASRI